MHGTTDLEKKSLEAHVDLCAQRYRFLEEKMLHLSEKIETQGNVINEVHDMVHAMAEKRNDQVLGWSLAIIAGLLTTVGYLLAVYVIK